MKFRIIFVLLALLIIGGSYMLFGSNTGDSVTTSPDVTAPQQQPATPTSPFSAPQQ